jgi:HEAT repeat protein
VETTTRHAPSQTGFWIPPGLRLWWATRKIAKPSDAVRHQAVAMFVQIGPVALDALDNILRNGKSSIARRSAIDAIRDIGGERAAGILVAAFHSPGLEEPILSKALIATGPACIGPIDQTLRKGCNPHTLYHLMDVLKTVGAPDIPGMALEWPLPPCGWWGGGDALSTYLSTICKTGSTRAAERVLDILQNLGNSSFDEKAAEAIAALFKHVEDERYTERLLGLLTPLVPDVWVNQAAHVMGVLGFFGDGRALLPMLAVLEATHKERKHITPEMIRALGHLGDSGANQPLMDLFLNDKITRPTRLEILRVLPSLGANRADFNALAEMHCEDTYTYNIETAKEYGKEFGIPDTRLQALARAAFPPADFEDQIEILEYLSENGVPDGELSELLAAHGKKRPYFQPNDMDAPYAMEQCKAADLRTAEYWGRSLKWRKTG